ncbi:MAG: alkaline phosphatase [Halieaceae bacterium]
MTTSRLATLLAFILLAGTAWAQEAEPVDPPLPSQRNVILIIGDGMDDQQITIARNYLKGASGRLILDDMPMRGAMQILTIEDKIDGKPVYVADSANTATSMATGEITSRGRLATSAGDNRPLPTIVEIAEAAGYRTGLVSTASITDATPSAFAAHISFRLCQGPDLMIDIVYSDIPLGGCPDETKAAGGLGSVAEQLAASDVDVLLGGGNNYFEMTAEGSDSSVKDIAADNGFTFVSSVSALAAASSADRVLGLFSDDTMPVRLRGEDGRKAEAPEPSWLNQAHRYLGSVTQPAPMDCEPNPDFAGTPSLKQMTDAALAILPRDGALGFFLMIESASIDKQSHERKPCGSIGELEQLDEALASALAFAKTNPNTLVLVTADHSQAAQMIPSESLFSAYPIPVYSPGKVARIRTPEGSLMAVNYATTNFFMEEHTGANVPIFGNTEALGRVPTYVSQPQLFGIMKSYLALD